MRGPNGTPVQQHRTLADQLGGAFKLFGALVAAAFVVTAVAYGVGRVWLAPELEHSRLAVAAESKAYAAMVDEENGLRGYLLTHDLRFLGPYARGETRLARVNDALTASVGSVPELALAMLDMRLAEEKWREQWAKVAADTAIGSAPPSMTDGMALFDVYRLKEGVLADAMQHRDQELSARFETSVAIRVALELVVFMMVLLLAVRQHRALRAEIVAPVAALLLHIRTIPDGDLGATAEGAGAHELAELAEGLNEMVRALTTAQRAAASRDEMLRDHSVQLRQILEASREFSESLNLAYVVGAVRASTAAVGGYEQVTVWLMDDERKQLINSDATVASDGVEIGLGLAGRAAKSGRITFEGPTGQVRFIDSDMVPVRAIAIPLIVGARAVGVLEARHAEVKVATKQVVEVLEMLATHAATAIESARLHEVVEERSHVDALTRLFNRRRLEQDLDAEFRRSTRYGRPLTFVMLDVDHFKQFNDSHGHPEADTALQEIADVISSCARTTDTTYRYGGEEFCILLRETTAEDGVKFAERVRQRIEQRFASGGRAGITASFGVADYSTDMQTARSLIEAADVAMYESKHAGRNRVALSSRPPAKVALSS